MARLNNLSARLLVNQWFKERGQEPLGGELSYVEFATELRRRLTDGVRLVDFVERSDAVRYVRQVAHQLVATP